MPERPPPKRPERPEPPEPGTVLVLAEADYKFGSGPLLCRVGTVIALVRFEGQPWWHLRGDCARGTPQHHSGWTPRELYVRAARRRPPR